MADIEKNLPNIILEFLPAYSPDYNLIELVRTRLARSPRQLDMSVWHSAKEYIAHREFENQEQLAKVVNNLLNKGGLTINWSKNFKNYY